MAKRIRDSLGERMKRFESAMQTVLPLGMPTILRLDGNAFHTWTKGLKKPFDEGFINLMAELALCLCRKVATTKIAYVQSDEISLLLHNYQTRQTGAYFENRVQKMVSIAAGQASAFFTQKSGRIAVFDARAFVLPESEVVNYFIWRQQDASRNSVNGVALSHYGHKALQGKKQNELHEMMHQKGVNWNNLPTHLKRGLAVIKTLDGWKTDKEIPIFSERREYIQDLLVVEKAKPGKNN